VGTPEVEALKAVLVHSNQWAEVCTICVFAGLIVEYTILLWLKRKSFSPLELTLTILAGTAIAGGVFGEYHFGKAASNAAIKLGNISEGQVVDAENRLGKAEDGLRTAIGEAGDAKQSADKASIAADRANTSAQQANDQAGISRQRAEEIGTQADELRAKTLELATKLSDAQTAELAERKQLLDMEKWLSPRNLVIIGGPEGLSWARLKPFAGTDAIVKSVMHAESRRAAGEISGTLQQAGWNIVKPTFDFDSRIADGVTVWRHLAAQGGTEAYFGEEGRSLDAALAVANFLDNNGWDVELLAGPRLSSAAHWIPSNTVLIEVGLKPNPYIFISPHLPKWAQEQMKKSIESRHQRQEEERRLREEQKRYRALPQPWPLLPVVPPNRSPEKQ
jgi:hypothetical protein